MRLYNNCNTNFKGRIGNYIDIGSSPSSITKNYVTLGKSVSEN